MGTQTRRWLLGTAALALLAAAWSAPAAQAESQTWQGSIPGGWADPAFTEDCWRPGSCPHLEGVGYVHVDVSDLLADAPDPGTSDGRDPEFRVVNPALTSETTRWFVCANAGDWVDVCWRDNEFDFGFWGNLRKADRHVSEITSLRLFPLNSAPNEYWLKVWDGNR